MIPTHDWDSPWERLKMQNAGPTQSYYFLKPSDLYIFKFPWSGLWARLESHWLRQSLRFLCILENLFL